MKKVYTLLIDDEVKKIMNETYHVLLTAAQYRNSKIRQLIDDEELSSLHDILPLLRLGHLKIYQDDDGERLFLEVQEG